ncbi:hypothetical protein IAU60_006145 [Kwoniella sp. DSM 27419]
MAPHNIPIIDAEHLLACQNTLGEGAVWESKSNLLHWVDIMTAELHSYNPDTRAHSVDQYPESHCLTYVTPRRSEPGFIGTLAGSLVVLPPATDPTEISEPGKASKPKVNIRKSEKTLSQPLDDKLVEAKTIRFNDGGVDPSGRVFYGSMGNDENAPEYPGELWRYDLDGTQTKIFDKIGVSNGLGFSPDGKTMYYVDSRKDRVEAYAYDPSTGQPSNMRVFATPPPPLDDSRPTEGVFDGLCMDGVGNVWVARWRDQRIVGYNPEGEIIAFIKVGKAKSPTIPCFGGKDLTTMYIATATSHLGGEGNDELFPLSGDLFSVDFGPGSKARQVVGEAWKGAERHRAAI